MVASESLGFNSAAFNSCSIPVYSLFNVTRIIPTYYFFLIQELPHLACNKKENMHTYVHITEHTHMHIGVYVSLCVYMSDFAPEEAEQQRRVRGFVVCLVGTSWEAVA